LGYHGKNLYLTECSTKFHFQMLTLFSTRGRFCSRFCSKFWGLIYSNLRSSSCYGNYLGMLKWNSLSTFINWWPKTFPGKNNWITLTKYNMFVARVTWQILCKKSISLFLANWHRELKLLCIYIHHKSPVQYPTYRPPNLQDTKLS